jgi:NAD(P)-dependent dehydrogenase (short-subunit alcohol dehydrogenase family)
MSMAGRLQGKVAIITGASRGLGQYCAEGNAREGAKVVIAARTEVEKDPRLPGTIYHTAKLIEDAGGEAFPVVCNVADNDSVEAMVRQVLEKYGRVDIMMNNAAVQPAGFISTIPIRHWELEFRVNVHGTFYGCRAVLPAMIEQKSGNIINISSVGALGGSHYGATKRAVEAMSIGLAAEQKENGIAVNAFKPVRGVETPGLLFGRAPGQVGGPRPAGQEIPPPDSYVEAAILLAMQTPDTFTGQVVDDAQVIVRLGDKATQDKMRSLNPDWWVAAMDAAS